MDMQTINFTGCSLTGQRTKYNALYMCHGQSLTTEENTFCSKRIRAVVNTMRCTCVMGKAIKHA